MAVTKRWNGPKGAAYRRVLVMHAVRSDIPGPNPLAKAEFATIRERLIKISARVIEHIARIRIHLPTSCPERALFREIALGLMPAVP